MRSLQACKESCSPSTSPAPTTHHTHHNIVGGRRRASSSMNACRACPFDATPAWCGILSPPELADGVTLTLCPGEPPAAALQATCSEPSSSCNHSMLNVLARDLMARVIGPRGRAALAGITRWMPPKDNMYGSIPVAGNINYGVQPQTEPQLDSRVDSRTSYSDLLAWMLLSLSSPLSGGPRYLEIGVSVGKNLHQLTSHAAAHFAGAAHVAELIGLDLEPFNPQLRHAHPQLSPLIAEWPSPAEVVVEAQTHHPEEDAASPSTTSLKRDRSSTVAAHVCHAPLMTSAASTSAASASAASASTATSSIVSENGGGSAGGDSAGSSSSDSSSNAGCSLLYISADLKTHHPWEALASRASRAEHASFDLVFSDAWHSPAALHWEMRQLLGRQLLSRRAVVVWDDMDTPGMQQAFGSLCLLLRRDHPAVRPPVTAAASDAAIPAELGRQRADHGGGEGGGGEGGGGESTADEIECYFSAVAPGWVASNHSSLIGIAGPRRVLDGSRLEWVLPSRLPVETFGFRL